MRLSKPPKGTRHNIRILKRLGILKRAPKSKNEPEITNPLVKSEDLNPPALSKDKAEAIRQTIAFCKSTDAAGLMFDRGMGLIAWLRGAALNALEGRLEHGDWQIVYKEIGYSQQSCSWYRRIAARFSRQEAEGFGYQKCREILDEEKSLEGRPRKGDKADDKKGDGKTTSDKKMFDVRVFAADLKKLADKTTELLKRSGNLKKSWASKTTVHSLLTNSKPFLKTAAANIETLRSKIDAILAAKKAA